MSLPVDEVLLKKLERASAEKPLLRIGRHYDPLLTLWRHPAHLGAGIFTPIFMLPEIEWVLSALTGIDGPAGTFLSLFSCFLVALGWPLFDELMECRVFRCAFYSDRLELTCNWLAREKTSVPYRNLSGVGLSRNWMQKRMGLGDLEVMIEPQAGRIVLAAQKAFTLRDIRRPEQRLEKITKILASFHAAGGPGA